MLRHFFSSKRLMHWYLIIIALALLAAWCWPAAAGKFSPYSSWFLAGIFFLSALKLELGKLTAYRREWGAILLVNLIMLIILPALVYYLSSWFDPDLSLAFLLLAAMPAAMTAPVLAEVSGGKADLAMILTVTTSLLSPLTVPLVIKVLAGSSVSVGFMTMSWSLFRVVVLPLALGQVVKFYFPRLLSKAKLFLTPLSLFLLGFILLGGFVQPAVFAKANWLTGNFWLDLVGLMVLFILFHALAYFGFWWQDKKERITITICLTYMNFVLAVYLADRFFNNAHLTTLVALAALPWSILIFPFRYFTRKVA